MYIICYDNDSLTFVTAMSADVDNMSSIIYLFSKGQECYIAKKYVAICIKLILSVILLSL